jgi:hypothetical protein
MPENSSFFDKICSIYRQIALSVSACLLQQISLRSAQKKTKQNVPSFVPVEKLKPNQQNNSCPLSPS